jgi:predicted ATPase/class 3 adenylate cyclase
MTAMPSGTVTFLFSDIEGSTRLWEQHPEAMKAALARHDAILREAVTANDGYIVKTTGDGVHAAFQTAGCALAAAFAAQQALQAETWPEIQPQAVRVRMGIHTGEAEARASDYYGPALNRAARLMAVGYGGQVLVSAATAMLTHDGLPDGATLLDLGEHRLKDLVAPERIYQLTHPALPNSFPSLKSLDAYPNNLPVQLTRFIGRKREIDEAKQLLDAHRLVTFAGSGGTGKTRLALQLAAETLSQFVDGVWLVELAPLADGGLVLTALASALGLHEVPGSPLLTVVTDYLRAKRSLIILDNCEHLIEASARLADHLLRACPLVKILTSSREALSVPGETAYQVPSLAVPEPDETGFEVVGRTDAAELFADRARATNPRFALTAANALAVAQICRRLDGIPLALELAAARTRLFPPEQIAARLGDRFRLLTGGSRTALPRQQTLRAMIDWSYDLLTEDERALLRGISVFADGWTFEAADAVCAGLDVLTLLDQLVNKSLVIMEEREGQARYHLLETIRQYARDRLLEAGEGPARRDRHLDYFLQLSELAWTRMRGTLAFAWFERLEPEEENIRAAAEWGLESRPVAVLLLLANLLYFWTWVGHEHRQILDWLKQLVTVVEVEPEAAENPQNRTRALARGYTCLCQLQGAMGDYMTGLAAAERALTFGREQGDPFVVAWTLWIRAIWSLNAGFDLDTAYASAKESVAISRAFSDPLFQLPPMSILAAVEERRGNPEEAARLRAEVRAHLEQEDDDRPLFLGLFLGSGIEARLRGRLDDAEAYFRRGLKIAQRLKSRQMTTVLESEMAHLARERGELRPAKAAYVGLIARWKDLGQYPAVAHQLECFALIALAEGQSPRAATLFGAAEALRDKIQIFRRTLELAEYQQAVATLRGQLDASALAGAWAAGRAMDMDHAIQYAVTPSEPPQP